MHEDVQQQLIEQATTLQKDILSAEANLNLLKESYLKVQGARELLNHLRASGEGSTTSEDQENNVGGNESKSV
jgi:prefoldin subunit 5